MSKLLDLKQQIETADKGAQELDERIHAALRSDDNWWQCIVKGRALVAEGKDEAVIEDERGNRMMAGSWARGCCVPAYTASLDAALALVERLLPGWLPYVEKLRDDRWFAGIRVDETAYVGSRSAFAATPALALLSALLSALTAKEQGK